MTTQGNWVLLVQPLLQKQMDTLVLPPLKRASQSMCHLLRAEKESRHSFLFLFLLKLVTNTEQRANVDV